MPCCETLQADPYENKVFDYFDFLSWIDGKLEKKSFAVIVKKKYTETTR